VEQTAGDSALWSRTTALKNDNPQLKVILTVSGWYPDGSASQYFSNYINSSAGTSAFAQSALNVMEYYGFDGIDIDWKVRLQIRACLS
jgi:chitinase